RRAGAARRLRRARRRDDAPDRRAVAAPRGDAGRTRSGGGGTARRRGRRLVAPRPAGIPAPGYRPSPRPARPRLPRGRRVGRRLGYPVRGAACAGLLFATLSIVALEASTAQNDLVAASLPATAAAFLLGRRPAELALAGVAVGLATGVKLTTLLVLPVLLLLA